MIVYLLLGLGFFLVFLSVIYTYRINREVSQFENHWGMRSITEDVEQPTNLIDPGNQLLEKINGLVGQLEELIGDLREQEVELTQILSKARQCNVEPSDKPFVDVLEQQIFKKGVVALEVKAQQDESSTTHEQVILPKYDQIMQLVREGLMVSEIAQKLNLGHREVDLVVKMNSQEADSDV